MSKILIQTQYCENYAAHDWDGTGECPQYWKMKGGEEYFIPIPADFPLANVAELVKKVEDKVQWENNYSQSTLLGWEVVPDDFMTEFEKNQLEFDGRILFPAKVLEA